MNITRHPIFLFAESGNSTTPMWSIRVQARRGSRSSDGRLEAFWKVKVEKKRESESESLSVVSNSLRPHMDCSLPESSVHGILQARILEWLALPFSRGSSQPRVKPRSPTLQSDSLPSELPGKPRSNWRIDQISK